MNRWSISKMFNIAVQQLGFVKNRKRKLDIIKPHVIIVLIVNYLECESINKATSIFFLIFTAILPHTSTISGWRYCHGCQIFLTNFCCLIMPRSSEPMNAKGMHFKLCDAHQLQLESDKTHWSPISSLSRHITSSFLGKHGCILSLMKTASAWHGISHHKLISTPNYCTSCTSIECKCLHGWY